MLPLEIINKIYTIKHQLEYTDCIKEIKEYIKINEYYIIRRYDLNNPNRLIKQYAKIDGYYETEDGEKTYSFYYGVFGFHEGFATRAQILRLTAQERQYSINNQYWKLPQQFYQSGFD